MEIKIPEVGESVREALVAKWFKPNGSLLKKDEPVCEIETDKITLDIHADAAGVLSIVIAEGTTVKIGTVIGTIAETARPESSAPPRDGVSALPKETAPSSPAARREMREMGIDPSTVPGHGKGGKITLDDLFSRIEEHSRRSTEKIAEIPPATDKNVLDFLPPFQGEGRGGDGVDSENSATYSHRPHLHPNLPPEGEGTKAVNLTPPPAPPQVVRSEEPPLYAAQREERKPMSPIRRRIAERLVAARQQTAMLTTFNEVDMGRVDELRARFRQTGVTVGIIPFFVKACAAALKEFPAVNASIDGDDIVFHNFCDIGIAIAGEKGLVVPVLRDADRLSLVQIEKAVAGFAEKVKTNHLALADLEGGTFTISNGGVFGSMLSTPLLNPPQSGVLGMHVIQERPVARDGQVVIRRMMYLALSYDHRIIDGQVAVGFLKYLKDALEDADRLLG